MNMGILTLFLIVSMHPFHIEQQLRSYWLSCVNGDLDAAKIEVPWSLKLGQETAVLCSVFIWNSFCRNPRGGFWWWGVLEMTTWFHFLHISFVLYLVPHHVLSLSLLSILNIFLLLTDLKNSSINFNLDHSLCNWEWTSLVPTFTDNQHYRVEYTSVHPSQHIWCHVIIVLFKG